MELALRSGTWDVEALEAEIPKRVVDRWESWFERRPQSMHHLYSVLASIASAICGSNGFDAHPDLFLWWRNQDAGTQNTASQADIDRQWNAVSGLIKKATPKTDDGVTVDGKSGELDQQSDPGCNPVRTGGAIGDSVESGTWRFD